MIYSGLAARSAQGAVLAGMVLGAIAVFIIDRRFIHAAGACLLGAALTLVGLIHGPGARLLHGEDRARLRAGRRSSASPTRSSSCPSARSTRPIPMDVEQAAEREAPRFDREEERVAVPA